MSVEKAKEFFDQVDSDQALRDELSEVGENVLDLARKHGFNFSYDDMREHLKDRWGVTKPPKPGPYFTVV
jgi:predicted ribosomally synthesized peptide with nif11-like leader